MIWLLKIKGSAIVASHFTSTNSASFLSLPQDFPSSKGAPDEPPPAALSVVICIP